MSFAYSLVTFSYCNPSATSVVIAMIQGASLRHRKNVTTVAVDIARDDQPPIPQAVYPNEVSSQGLSIVGASSSSHGENSA